MPRQVSLENPRLLGMNDVSPPRARQKGSHSIGVSINLLHLLAMTQECELLDSQFLKVEIWRCV